MSYWKEGTLKNCCKEKVKKKRIKKKHELSLKLMNSPLTGGMARSHGHFGGGGNKNWLINVLVEQMT